MQHKHIIFLDIDGVICTRRTRYRRMDKECMGYLKRIVDESGASIVISSAWKYSHTLKQFKSMLGRFKIRRVIGTTPNLDGEWIRGKEIEKWISNNYIPKSFVILDDDTDMEPFMDKLVQTDCELGLTDKDADKAISMLKSTTLC